MAEQLVFDLPVETAFGRNDFFTSAANNAAVTAVETWQSWPLGKLVLVGPEGAGKSHLAQIWADLSSAAVVQALENWDPNELAQGSVCVEDVPRIAGHLEHQEKLFHLHNMMAQGGQALMMTGCGVPGGWNISLPDLGSRIQGSYLVQLGAPDDTLLAAVLVKLCADRQLQVEPRMVRFILRRTERSFAHIRRLVEELDRVSLQRKRPVGQWMISETLRSLEENA